MATDEFVTQLLQLGVGGIDLKRSIDLVSPLRLARMTNLARNEEGRLATRPGQRRFAWAPGAFVHSVARLQAALAGGEFIRLAGVDSALFWGKDGSLLELARDFSGQPFTFVPGRPPLSGDSWMYIGDAEKMVKVRSSDRLTLPIGLRVPVAAAVAAVGSDNQAAVDSFESAGWTNNAGSGGAPSNATTTDAKAGANSVAFTSAKGSATGAYYNFWGKALSLDLSELVGVVGVAQASDNDQFHLWLKIDKPALVDEIRLYFVVSPSFSATTLPGTSTTLNTDAYVKSFIPSAFTPLVEAEERANTALAEAVSSRQLEEILSAEVARIGGAATAVEQQDETRAVAHRRLALGRGQWTEFGAPGTPLRRGEFLRIGSNTSYDWSTVTGLVIFVKTNTNQTTIVQFDDLFLRGGYNLDSSEPTSVAYDWRYRHYDPRTGARSRWSPVMADADKLDLVRQNAKVTPEAYGDPAIRQEFSRRGGTIPSNWYFVGTNRSDGGCGKDNVTDNQALAAGTSVDDNFHQPVSTVDRDGNAVYAQPIPIIFGPVQGILLGLGDPYRPGHVYWTLPDEFDHWPLFNNVEVCSPDEELMNGGVFGGQAFAFSRLRMHSLLVSIVDTSVKAVPTACAKGLAARFGMVVGLDGVYFVAADGVWKTTGGTPQNLTDDFIEPLFRGTRKNGYAPIDWAAAGAIRLAIHLNELWFLFQDVDGGRQVWIYSLIFQFWRHYSFGWPVASFASEEYGQPQLLLGSSSTGRIYVHDGTHDDGLAISPVLRSGALHMGLPRQNKLFGDLELEMDLQGVLAQVVTYADQEGRTISTRIVQPLVGPQVYIVDAFGSTPLQAKDVSFEVSWSALGTSPSIGRGGPSFVPQPESTLGRITDWDALGGGANKILKGILIEADTFGYLKNLQVMVDGGTTAATSFTIQTQGRQFKHIVFSSQLEARNVRLAPADEAPWIPYELRWMFDVDPLELTRWETQPIDHGIQTEQVLGEAFITTKSTVPVTLTITAYQVGGAVAATGVVTIPSSGGLRVKNYVKLPTLRGVLFKYVFTSSVAHRLYREESVVFVIPWGAEQPIPVQPFGTDDLDSARIVRDAEGAGLRGQRWIDTSVRAGQQQ